MKVAAHLHVQILLNLGNEGRGAGGRGGGARPLSAPLGQPKGNLAVLSRQLFRSPGRSGHGLIFQTRCLELRAPGHLASLCSWQGGSRWEPPTPAHRTSLSHRAVHFMAVMTEIWSRNRERRSCWVPWRMARAALCHLGVEVEARVSSVQ